MKRLFLILSLLFSSLSSFAAKESTISGRVVDQNGDAIGYATVVLTLLGEQIAGDVTNEQGDFKLLVGDGEYEIAITYLGYKSYEASVKSGSDLGEITLSTESTQIEDVVVTSTFLRREADRFIVDVANAPSAIGQDGEELLRSSPGVWIMDDDISINGKSGPKVFVNDRELKMSNEQIIMYLRNLKSNDVSRIEIIPQSGADFDASSSSGIIMIYLKRQLRSGIVGSVTFNGNFSSELENYAPSMTLNYQSSKLTLNTSLWYNDNRFTTSEENNTIYSSLGSEISEMANSDEISISGGGRVEAIYQFNDRHSVAGELSLLTEAEDRVSNSSSSYLSDGVTTLGSNLYDATSDKDNLSATFNYIYKLDTLGSTLKLLADYNTNSGGSFSDNRSTSVAVDSLYQNNSTTLFKVASVTLAAEKIVNPKLTLKAGAKYTYNDMDSRSNYTYWNDNSWQDLTDYNSDELYSENIAAAYLIASSRLARWSFVAGLRGEYTQTKGRDNLLNKDYMSWFPNLNVSYMLDPTGSNSLTAQYSRSISRPSFWSLNPARTQTSEYFYAVGNPSLLPQYSNAVSLTYVYKYKYSLTAAMDISQNGVQQIMKQDADDPTVTYITPENISNQNSYYLAAYLPFQIAKWWSLSTNLTYFYRSEDIYGDSNVIDQNSFVGFVQSTFILPRKYSINLSYIAMSDIWSGNICVEASQRASVSINKRFFDDKFSASLKTNALFVEGSKLTSWSDGVEQRMVLKNGWMSPYVGVSLSYNFKAGKEYRAARGVESSSPEDRARMASEKNE